MDRATVGGVSAAANEAIAAARRLARNPHVVALVKVTLAVLAVLTVIGVFVVEGTEISTFGFDSRSYWGFPRPDLYAGTESANGMGIYRYAPAFAPLLELFSRVDWTAFSFLWFCLLAGTYLWLAGRWWFLALAFAPISFELYIGNIHLLLAAAIVIGFRYPATWAFVLLTKVTPGIGLLWFAVRGEWRSLAIALGATIAIVAVGVGLAPQAWVEWFRSLMHTPDALGANHVAIALPIRLAVAALVVIWGARTNRPWTVVVAATLGLPTLWTHGEALLIGLIPLLDPSWGTRSPAARLLRWLRSRRGPDPRVATSGAGAG